MKYTSQLVAAGSGSVAGCTFSRNRFGQYIRQRAVPVNPSSTAQQLVRNAFTTLVTRWTSILTQAQRDAWATWAANTPQTDPLGSSYTMTGQNAFISMNTIRLYGGFAVIDDAPTVYAMAALTAPTLISATAATSTLSVDYTNTDGWAIAVGGALVVFVARPQNPSVLFFKGPYLVGGAINGAATPPVSPGPIISPYTFAAGNRIHVQMRAINADGRISSPYRLSVIAV